MNTFAEILTVKVPAGLELLHWELVLYKYSWYLSSTVGYLETFYIHSEIPTISQMPENCNSDLQSEKVKNN